MLGNSEIPISLKVLAFPWMHIVLYIVIWVPTVHPRGHVHMACQAISQITAVDAHVLKQNFQCVSLLYPNCQNRRHHSLLCSSTYQQSILICISSCNSTSAVQSKAVSKMAKA